MTHSTDIVIRLVPRVQRYMVRIIKWDGYGTITDVHAAETIIDAYLAGKNTSKYSHDRHVISAIKAVCFAYGKMNMLGRHYSMEDFITVSYGIMVGGRCYVAGRATTEIYMVGVIEAGHGITVDPYTVKRIINEYTRGNAHSDRHVISAIEAACFAYEN